MSEDFRPLPNTAESSRAAAERKFRDCGSFGVTALDHRSVGSTPPDELEANPGKTLADLMSDEAIRVWIARERAGLETFRQVEPADPMYDFAQKRICQAERDLALTESYLTSIGRLA